MSDTTAPSARLKTTAELIVELRALDPEGTREVAIEVVHDVDTGNGNGGSYRMESYNSGLCLVDDPRCVVIAGWTPDRMLA